MMHVPNSQIGATEPAGILDALHAYWEEKRGDHALPARADLDPAEFHYALANVSIIDVLKEPLRFRFRLVGSNIQARFSKSLTGTYVDECPETENALVWQAVYLNVLRTGEPQNFVGRVVEDDIPRLFRGTCWPLASDHENIDMLLCCREMIKNENGLKPDAAQHRTM